MTEIECTCGEKPPPCPYCDRDGCARCGEDHWSGYEVFWLQPSEGGAERDLVVRVAVEEPAVYAGLVNVAIIHVYDKYLYAEEARAMAAALIAAADAIEVAK